MEEGTPIIHRRLQVLRKGPLDTDNKNNNERNKGVQMEWPILSFHTKAFSSEVCPGQLRPDIRVCPPKAH